MAQHLYSIHPGVSAVVLCALVGCYNVGPAPVPRELIVSRTPSEVVRAAASSLASLEFEIGHSDPSTGIIQARRVRGPHGNDQYIKCAHDKASTLASNLRSTVAISLTATPRGDSSAVRIATVVTASYPSLANSLAIADNEKDCITTGEAESRLAQALAGMR